MLALPSSPKWQQFFFYNIAFEILITITNTAHNTSQITH